METQAHEKRFERLVNGQHGRVTRAQLQALGVGNATIRGWIQAGRLYRVLPKVYAVGHRAPSREAELWAAILYAGPGAMLSHATAAQWRGLIDYPPRAIEVSTPRQIGSIGGVRVYGRRETIRHLHARLPVTSTAQTMLDLAATSDLRLVRRALAVLDYRHELDLGALRGLCKQGRAGSKRLREALALHQPELACTNGPLEVEFLEWCERHDVPVPAFNAVVHGVRVDAHWPGSDLVVELDGYDNHRSRAQLRRDKQNDLHLRGKGMTVLRYDREMIGRLPRPIRTEIVRLLGGS